MGQNRYLNPDLPNVRTDSPSVIESTSQGRRNTAVGGSIDMFINCKEVNLSQSSRENTSGMCVT